MLSDSVLFYICSYWCFEAYVFTTTTHVEKLLCHMIRKTSKKTVQLQVFSQQASRCSGVQYEHTFNATTDVMSVKQGSLKYSEKNHITHESTRVLTTASLKPLLACAYLVYYSECFFV